MELAVQGKEIRKIEVKSEIDNGHDPSSRKRFVGHYEKYFASSKPITNERFFPRHKRFGPLRIQFPVLCNEIEEKVKNIDHDSPPKKLSAYKGVRYGDDKDHPVTPPTDMSENLRQEYRLKMEKVMEDTTKMRLTMA